MMQQWGSEGRIKLYGVVHFDEAFFFILWHPLLAAEFTGPSLFGIDDTVPVNSKTNFAVNIPAQ